VILRSKQVLRVKPLLSKLLFEELQRHIGLSATYAEALKQLKCGVRKKGISLAHTTSKFNHDLSSGARLVPKDLVHEGEYFPAGEDFPLGFDHQVSQIFQESQP
jgi:hypothetical protein